MPTSATFGFPRRGQEAIVSDRVGGGGVQCLSRSRDVGAVHLRGRSISEKPSLTGTHAESLRAGRVQEKMDSFGKLDR